MFAWAKATQGNYYHDADFAVNEQNAKAAGVYIGAYDFADYNSLQGTNGAATEATYFWNFAGSYLKTGTNLQPMLDVELALTNNTGATVSAWIVQSVTTVSNLAAADGLPGVHPVIYTYQSFAADYLNSSVTAWPLWMASPNGQNAQTGNPSGTTPWSTWTLWQYNTSTSVPGVTGSSDCDQDVFNGTTNQFIQTFVIGNTNPPPPYAPAGATVYWDPGNSFASPGSGGAGTWDTSTTNWWYSGNSNVIFNPAGDYAVFAGTAAAVTMSSATAEGITFNVPGYTIGGSGTLSLSGTTPVISVPAGAPTYITCTLTGSGYEITGGGVLVPGERRQWLRQRHQRQVR